MIYEFEFETVSDLQSFLTSYSERIVATKIEAIYNVSSNCYYDHPVFFVTQDYVAEFFCSNGGWLTVYPRQLFEECFDSGSFCPPDGSVMTIWLEPSKRKCCIKKIRARTEGKCFTGVDFFMTDGCVLHTEMSRNVPGGMDSWIASG